METPSNFDPNLSSRSLRRRAFLRATGAAAATFALPPSLRAFDLGRPSLLRDGSVLGERLSFARQVGKPLLIFVIPENDEERWARGRRIGHWLNIVEDVEALIHFSMCEITCASLATLRRRIHIAESIQDPWLVVTDPSTKRRPLDGRAIAGPNTEWVFADRSPVSPDPDEEAQIAAEEASEREQLAELNRALQIAVEADSAAFDRLAKINRRRLTIRQLSAIQRAIKNGAELDDDTLYQGAATVIEELRDSQRPADQITGQITDQITGQFTEHAVGLQKQLAQAARERLRRATPAGARWARYTGCGSRFEREDGSLEPRKSLGGCGLGNIPRLGYRFLSFMTAED